MHYSVIQVLFRKMKSVSGEEYTDASNLMRVNRDTNILLYVDPTEEEETQDNAFGNNILQRSTNFVNEHGGWTDNYHYFGLDNDQKTVLFRLYLEGYPIFSEDSDVSELRLVWGKTDINRYVRSNFSLGILITTYPVIWNQAMKPSKGFDKWINLILISSRM